MGTSRTIHGCRGDGEHDPRARNINTLALVVMATMAAGTAAYRARLRADAERINAMLGTAQAAAHT